MYRWVVIATLLLGCGKKTVAGGAAGNGGSAAGSGNGGASGTVGSGGSGNSCPPYQAACAGGSCIPVSNDPHNCGSCGHMCKTTEVCSAGTCTATCLTGLQGCSGACVDIKTDNANCGVCGHVCGSGTGCVEGGCQNVTVVGTASNCTGGGPPLSDMGPGGKTVCDGLLAQTTFRWALCSCGNIGLSDHLTTDGFDSTTGAYTAGGIGAGVGLNGNFQGSSQLNVGGSLWSSSTQTTSVSDSVTVAQELHLGGALDSSSSLLCRGDAFIDGNVSSNVTIDGTLHVPTAASVSATVSVPPVRGNVTVPAPCDCQPNQLVPIASIVSSHMTNNDDASIGVLPSLLSNPGNSVRLDLPCGRFYFDSIGGSQPITIVAHGHTAIYIGGDVTPSNPLRITLDPTASLDVFVRGRFESSDAFAIGSPNYPALTRFYVGGAFSISDGAALGGFFYAAPGSVSASASLEAYGGIFAGSFSTSADVSIHYDRQILRAGEGCPGSGGSAGAGGSGAGGASGGGGSCSTCVDCGNQACKGGACGACTSSADCCAPLVCSGGQCVPILG
jgi:hypothetical protein